MAPGSKTMNKGLHDGADVLDERETQQCRSLFGTALNVGQDRPETQYTTEESARFMSDPTRAVKCMLKRLRKCDSEAPVDSWSFPHQEMQCEVRMVSEAHWEGELEGTVNDGRLDLFWSLFAGDVFFDTADWWRCLQRRVSTSRQKMLLMLWSSALIWRSAKRR